MRYAISSREVDDRFDDVIASLLVELFQGGKRWVPNLHLVKAVAAKESNSVLHPPPRFEPWYHRRLFHGPRFIQRYPSSEQRALMCFSWGPMQVIGCTAVELGLQAPIEYLETAEGGYEFGIRYLMHVRRAMGLPWELETRDLILLAGGYNGGPGRPQDDYGRHVLHIMEGIQQRKKYSFAISERK